MFLRCFVPLSMPVVRASDNDLNVHLAHLKVGNIRRLAGYVAGDNGENVLTVFSAFKRIGTPSKAGLILMVDLTFTTGVEVKKFGQLYQGNMVKGVLMHLWQDCVYNFRRARPLG